MAEKASPTSPVGSEEEKGLVESLTDAIGLTGEEEEEENASNDNSTPERKEEDSPSFLIPEEAVASTIPIAKPMPVKKGKAKREKRVPIPKDAFTFFRAMNKYPSIFKFTPTGDLQVPQIRDKEAFVIKLPYYAPLIVEDRVKREEERFEEMGRIQQQYDEIAAQLREAIDIWRSTGLSSDVLRLQREMQKVDAELTNLRSPSKWTKSIRGVERRDVLRDEPNLSKTLDHRLYILRLRSIGNQDGLVASERPLVKGRVDPETPSPIVKYQEPPEVFVLFDTADDPEHGDFSPETMVEFIFNSTKYNSPLQAYHGERLSRLNRKDLRPLLLRLRGGRQIRQFAARVVGDIPEPLELWVQILQTLVAQHPRFGTQLRETGTDVLVYANELDGKFGIGLSTESEEALDRDKWKGDNLLGKAWMMVRESLPPVETDVGSEDEQEKEKEQEGGGSYTEHGKTEGEAKEQRQKVLMGMYRRARQ